ncbi:MAG: hypothetical protein J5662_00575 [Clostridia bacterium]|nr:hypothetical protein [Clostridia bacterium]
MKKILLSVFLSAVFATLSAGCQGYREIDSEYLVSAIGFQYNESKYTVYTQVLVIAADKKDTKNELFYASGKTPYEAADDITALLPKKAVFDHCATALIQNGISGKIFKEIIKYLYDTKNLNLGICLYGADDIKGVLSLEAQTVSGGYDIVAVKNNIEKSTGIDFKNKYYEICSSQMSNGSFCLPEITIKEDRPAILSQTVYVDFYPVLKLAADEVNLYNLLRGGSGGGEISVSGKRLTVNKIGADVKLEGGVLFVKLHCRYRKSGEDTGKALKTETEKLLIKLKGTPALKPLLKGDYEKAQKVSVAVYG